MLTGRALERGRGALEIDDPFLDDERVLHDGAERLRGAEREEREEERGRVRRPLHGRVRRQDDRVFRRRTKLRRSDAW